MRALLLFGLWGCGASPGVVVNDSMDSTLAFECAGAPAGQPELCAHGASCMDVLAAGGSLGDGHYRLDPDGVGEGEAPFVAWCDMSTAGGGWTEISAELLRSLDLVRFEHIAGRGAPQMGWTDDDGMLLDPRDSDGCDTMALRATATLPFQFEAYWGEWTASSLDPRAQHDDFYGRLEWGEVTEDCRGHIKFGTAQSDAKSGGEWGQHWSGERSFSWGIALVEPTDTLRWELVDQGSPEDLLIRDLLIYVR